MARVSHLIRRGAAYSARIRVPLDLVGIVGRKELVKALGTNNEAEAKRRLWPVVVEWNREFDDLRSRRALVPFDREHATWDQYTGALDRDDAARANLPGEQEIEAEKARLIARVEQGEIAGIDPLAILDATLSLSAVQAAGEIAADARRTKLTEMRRHLARGETALIASDVDDYLRRNRLHIERASTDWITLARQMMRAEIEALERTFERDRGDYGGKPSDPLVKPPTINGRELREAAAPGESIAEALAVFAGENPRSVSQARMDESCRDVGIFMQLTGAGFPIAKITKKHVREWKALLIKYPVRATEVNAFKGMTMAQIVQENETLNRAVLSDRTVNRYLSSLSAFFVWAEANGYMTSNPCSGMALPKERHSKTLPFNSDQMNVLFKSPLFVGCKSANEWRNIAKPGTDLIRDHRYWVPLIMLFSGARTGEIGQLAVSDVRQEHGHWIMHITDEGAKTDEGKSVKTTGSIRVLPIHPTLIRLGFLSYHARRVADGGSQLFPGAKRNERGQMMSDVSREFGKYLTRIGLKSGRGLSLYSFRHGAADALRRAGYLDIQFGFILGHGEKSMTGRYGIMPQGMIEQRVELVNAIAYPGLNLDHLFTV